MDINFQWAFSLCHLRKNPSENYMHLKFVIMEQLMPGHRNITQNQIWVQSRENGIQTCVHVWVFLKKPDVPISKTQQASPRDLAETWFTVLKSAPGCRERRTKSSFRQHAILTGEFRQYYLLMELCSSKFSTFMKCLPSDLADSVYMINQWGLVLCRLKHWKITVAPQNLVCWKWSETTLLIKKQPKNTGKKLNKIWEMSILFFPHQYILDFKRIIENKPAINLKYPKKQQ